MSIAAKVRIDFTDDEITSSCGSLFFPSLTSACPEMVIFSNLIKETEGFFL